jgi:hypothetical protein
MIYLRYFLHKRFHNFFYTAWAKVLDILRETVDQFGELLSLAGTDPGQPEPVLIDTHLLDIPLQKMEPPQTFIIPFLVMAIAWMASTDQNAIGPIPECFQYKSRLDPPGTHHPDNMNVTGIFYTRSPCKVGTGVRTPIA